MKLGNPIPIAPGVFQIRAIGARVTVLLHDGQVLLIDTGMKRSAPILRNGLRALGTSLDRVATVVISHHHPDHAGALAELVACGNASVAAHRLEAAIIDGSEPRPNPVRNRLVARLTQPIIERLDGSPVKVDIELEDGDTLLFPSPVRVVHLPGHTPGSIALFLPDRKLIVVGDALQYRLGMRLSPPAANVTQDPQQALESLHKLLDLDFDAICFSHFPPMRSGGRSALRRMLNDR